MLTSLHPDNTVVPIFSQDALIYYTQELLKAVQSITYSQYSAHNGMDGFRIFK